MILDRSHFARSIFRLNIFDVFLRFFISIGLLLIRCSSIVVPPTACAVSSMNERLIYDFAKKRGAYLLDDVKKGKEGICGRHDAGYERRRTCGWEHELTDKTRKKKRSSQLAKEEPQQSNAH